MTVGAAIPGGTLAQVQPDAGRIQQELERSRVPGPAPRVPARPTIEEPARPASTAPDNLRFRVAGFSITRASAFAEVELQALLKEFVGRELSLADLERAAGVITLYYRDRGYFIARAYVPAQAIRDGIVEITVLEGKLDRITLKLATELRLRESVVDGTLRSSLPAGGVIREAELERGLLMLNDLPGVDVRSVLSPGAELGTSIITAEVSEGPLATGSLDFDNQGSKFTGPYRLGATLNLNNPSGYGDLFTARATGSSGTGYGRFAYQMPLGYSGFRLGGAYAETRYRLCCEFAPLEAKGEAQTATINAAYPFVRGRAFSLYGTAAYDARRFFNTTIAGPTSDKKANVITLGINGDNRDRLGGGGQSVVALAVSSGSLDLDATAANRAADAATARTHGRYGKTAYSLARAQPLGDTVSAYVAIAGQLASRNLDSSEKFVLGGPYGVRGYPMGEAAGDAGLLVNVELRYDFQPALQFTAFVDHGQIRLHRNEWAGWQGANTRIRNRYGLSSYGVGLNWNQPGSFLLRAGLAQRLGDNPGRDANDNDSDNTRDRVRLWLQGVKYF